jgi:hypothetical protein
MKLAFHSRVAITSMMGQHIRYVPSALASAMIRSGAALPDQAAGRIRTVVLVSTASMSAVRIGEPSQPSLGVRFTRWRRLDESASRIIEHHPRCTYE